ncbi:MAG TPA: multidrug efflux RND transporter permease subunit [Pyrinomonadaceae bacterium]|jgi:The (Largely Gram-negative Bacterial) Hydrophobe/Amphiphile Efflux-1 (HAE1) Family|nr:multidrug efflux RND transporter permease subunit [Pyrinomonadaceae bacterium]
MSNFFINRPIVAIVISILTLLIGVVVIRGLSIEQYPFLAPPNIRVTATYPGASAEAVEQSVATPVEQEVNGVDRMIYMKSSNTSDGRMLLDVNFEVGTDQDTANVLTQNRVSTAAARLPAEVNQQGVTVKKQSPSILMLISLFSPGDAYDANFLINYCGINLRDQILRIPGIAQVDLFGGTDYGMRVWIKPDRLAKLGLTPADVISAIKEQNLQAPAGKVGGAPTPKDQEFTETLSAPGRLITPEEFENVIVRQTASGSVVRIKDIGRAELGSQDYNSFGRLNGKPGGAMAVYLLPGANQLKAAETIYETMEHAKSLFPPNMDYKIVYDTTPAVEASIHEILKTFVEALILVTLVVFIFLQNIRATIIPLLTIPISLVGTFIFFPLLGFSVNTLSMFGLVLAIGIVVDDAIVVVEAVIHHLEHGLPPKEATIKAMSEVSAPVIGIALILSAVFVPVALLGGLVGSMYKQFALTIAISVLLSAFNALSLTPALCALLLKEPKPMRGPLGVFFRGFNKVFDVTTAGYVHVSRLLVRRGIITIGIVGVVILGALFFAKRIPAGFIPDEDQGILGINVQLPPGASLERTSTVLKKVEEILAKTEGIESYQTIGGYGVVTNTYQSNYGSLFARLKPWEERHGEELHVKGIMAGLQKQFAAIPEGVIFPFNIPTLSGFGAASGFNFLIQDRTGTMTVDELGEQTRRFIAAGRQRPELGNLFSSFDPNYPQVKVDLDREKARTLGVPVNEVFQTMSAAMGGAFVNDFNRFGRLYRVYVQAESTDRLKATDIGNIYVRSRTTNSMVPLSTLVTIKDIAGTELTTRFNLLRSVELQGSPARGYTSGQALAALEEVFAQTMPKEMSFAYSSLSYQEKIAPPPGPTLILAIICVFLLLAAMYESWRLPWAVLLGSPLVALGALFGVWIYGYDNNVYVQIGLVMLIGLAAKNAILIVEFAKAKHDEGLSLEDAALTSARLRFRPILMTAFAFILGVIPLMKASGAGAGAQNVMGVGVFFGMLVATALGVFIIPGNFTFVLSLGSRWRKKAPAPQPVPATADAGGEH